MKQSTLIENILSKDNLNNAYLQVVRNKGAAGVDGMEYKALLSHLRKNGEQIKESIRNQTYKPMPVKRVEIPKEDGSKLDLCQYFEHKKLKGYADFFNSSSSFCCGVI